MIESVYYQILEYVIAPIGLMIFTFFVKGEKEVISSNISMQDSLPIEFKDNAIESLFIASYSHLLYYVSLSAHSHHYGNGICSREQFASLLAAIAGLLIIFIYKYFYGRAKNGDRKELIEYLIKQINRAAFGLMLFLTIIIIVSNTNINHVKWTFSLEAFGNSIYDWVAFLLQLNNLIFIPFVLIFLYAIFIKQPTRETTASKKLQTLTSSNGDSDKNKLMELYLDHSSPIEIRYNSIIKLVGQYMQSQNYEEALNAVKKAKELAINYNYPESQMIALRYIIVELYCIFNNKEDAEKEIKEVENNKTKDDAINQEFYDLWVKKLREIMTKYK